MKFRVFQWIFQPSKIQHDCSLRMTGSVSLNMNTKADQKDMYLPGNCLSSTLGFEPSKKRPFHSGQNKGRLGSRYTLIHYTCYMFSSFHTDYHSFAYLLLVKRKLTFLLTDVLILFSHISHCDSDKIQGLHEEADLKKSGDHSLLLRGFHSWVSFKFRLASQPTPMVQVPTMRNNASIRSY